VYYICRHQLTTPRLLIYPDSLYIQTTNVAKNVAKMVSEAWKSLLVEDREYWDNLARRDKERYKVEKSLYDGPWKVPAQKASKDPNAPSDRCPLSSPTLNSKAIQCEA
jgi:hypothetical protein